MFARLRGVPEKQIKNVVDTEIARVDLKKYANKKCGNYRLVQLHVSMALCLLNCTVMEACISVCCLTHFPALSPSLFISS